MGIIFLYFLPINLMDEEVSKPHGSTSPLRDLLLVGAPLSADLSDVKQLQDGSWVVSILVEGVEYADEVVVDDDNRPMPGESVQFSLEAEGEKPHMKKVDKVEITPEA